MTFLETVVSDLVKKTTGNDFSNYMVVFPNKRASAFFNDALYRKVGGEVWTPKYLSIAELFASLSDLQLVDSIEAVCRLYNVYKNIMQSNETLDQFWSWGEILLEDFNDIDRNLPFNYSAESLLKNAKDLHELDVFNYLTEEQRSALNAVCRNSANEASKVQERFARVWAKLFDIYTQFNHELEGEGLAYEGALQRRVVNNDLENRLPKQTLVFVGFNILSRVERELFEAARKNNKALFYWDYDTYYLKENPGMEAGLFLKKNLKDFPNQLGEDLFHNYEGQKEFEFVQAQTENGQAYYAPAWIAQNLTRDDARKTAVVLCNEDLIDGIVHALPTVSVADVNLTKGYPVVRTSAYAIVDEYFRRSQKKTLTTLKAFSELLDHVGTATQQAASRLEDLETAEAEAQAGQPDRQPSSYSRFMALLDAEALFQVYASLNRLYTLHQKGLFDVNISTLHRLVRQLIGAQTIPFEGDPLVGVQILGMLETRNLDFEHILILSANENYLPQTKMADSYIPYILRKAYELTLPEHKTAATSYHFYRLLQRASKVTFVYNGSENNGQPCDRSRYLLQLLVSGKHPIRKYAIECHTQPTPFVSPRYGKPANMVELLLRSRHLKDPYLSPSAINSFIDCPLQFYYNNVARLKREEILDDDIDGRTFGNLFHLMAMTFYKAMLCQMEPKDAISDKNTWIDKPVDCNELKRFAADNNFVEEILDLVFDETKAPKNPLVMETLRRQLTILTDEDAKRKNLRILALEHTMTRYFEVDFKGKKIQIPIGGIIDRLDSYDDDSGERVVRVLDYKTGRTAEGVTDMKNFFTTDNVGMHDRYYLQIFLYALIVRDQIAKGQKVSAQLFHPYGSRHHFVGYGKEPYIIDDKDFKAYEDEFMKMLNNRMFADDNTFSGSDKSMVCRFCDYRLLCLKDKVDY